VFNAAVINSPIIPIFLKIDSDYKTSKKKEIVKKKKNQWDHFQHKVYQKTLDFQS